MAELGQGLVLMVAGMGIVYVFLWVLIVITRLSCGWLAKYDHLLPQDAPKKKAPPKKAAGEDANIALALAIVLGAQKHASN